jgi:hypothetical protein
MSLAAARLTDMPSLKPSSILLPIGLALCGCPISASNTSDFNDQAVAHWTWRNPQLPPITVNDVVYANGLFTVAGEFGLVASSSDRVQWTVFKSGTVSNLNSITFGGGQYVAVGEGGTIIRSANGLEWSASDSTLAISLPSISYGNGRFVCVGTNGTILTSTNAISWSVPEVPVADSLSAVAYGNGTFVAVGEFGTVLTSSDGLGWTIRDAGTTTFLRNLHFVAGQFVVLLNSNYPKPPDGNSLSVLTSATGANWTPKIVTMLYYPPALGNQNAVCATPDAGLFTPEGSSWYFLGFLSGGPIKAATFGNGKYFAAGKDGLSALSSDGLFWGQPNAGVNPSEPLESVAFGNGKFVAVGSRMVRATSADLTAWSLKLDWDVINATLYGVAAGNGVFVASGQGSFFSQDGISWNLTTISGSALTFGNGEFLAGASPRYNAISTDGNNWSIHKTQVGPDATSATFGNGQFLSVAGNLILSSVDGVSWSTRYTLPSGYFKGVTFGAGTFVAVGNNGQNQALILKSTDSLNWVNVSPAVKAILNSATYGDGLFVAVGAVSDGSSAVIVSSPDATSWTTRDTDELYGSGLHGVAYGGGKFLAAGNADQQANMLASNDGIHWNRVEPFRRDLHGMAAGMGKVLVVGKGGKFLVRQGSSPFVTANTGSANDLNGISFGLDTFIAVGKAGTLLTSSNVIDWTPRNSRTTSDLFGVAFGNEKFVALGSSAFRYSSNSTSWTVAPDGEPGVFYKAIAFGRERFVAVGATAFDATGKARVSTNGIDWIHSTPPISGLNAVAFGNDIFVAGGGPNSGLSEAGIAVSSDGIQWQTGVLPVHDIVSLSFGGGIFVAATIDGLVLSSRNGIDWDRKERFFNQPLYCGGFFDSSFYLAGANGAVLQSAARHIPEAVSLTWRVGDGQLALEWPKTTNAFQLESSLLPQGNWDRFPDAPQVQGNILRLNISLTDTQRYFRLKASNAQ